MGTGSEVYESLANEAHHHLICQKCGRVYTINNDEVGQFFREVERSNQFKIKTNHLILFGLCRDCQ